MSDTTSWYECTKCGEPCDLKVMYPVSRSKCCGAPVKVVSSKTP